MSVPVPPESQQHRRPPAIGDYLTLTVVGLFVWLATFVASSAGFAVVLSRLFFADCTSEFCDVDAYFAGAFLGLFVATGVAIAVVVQLRKAMRPR